MGTDTGTTPRKPGLGRFHWAALFRLVSLQVLSLALALSFLAQHLVFVPCLILFVVVLWIGLVARPGMKARSMERFQDELDSKALGADLQEQFKAENNQLFANRRERLLWEFALIFIVCMFPYLFLAMLWYKGLVVSLLCLLVAIGSRLFVLDRRYRATVRRFAAFGVTPAFDRYRLGRSIYW